MRHEAWLWASAIAISGCAGAPPAPRAKPPLAPAKVAETVAEAPPEPPPPPMRLPCEDDDLVGCTSGCADSVREDCVTLATMYLGGAVVPLDRERGIHLLREACDGGSARGCMRLADVHHAGILSDLGEETRLYRQACEAGANLGCVAAGRAYLEARGVGRDPVFAATLFARVCQRGNAVACFELARLCERGEGVPRDVRRAFELYSKACKLGHDPGCLVASHTEEVLSPRE